MQTMITKALATAGLLAAVGAAPLMAQGHQGHEHGDEAPRAGMMMHQTMGTHMILEHADALELGDEQMARLEALQEQMESGMHRMMRGMMGSHAADCPMMGGGQEHHAHPGHPDGG